MLLLGASGCRQGPIWPWRSACEPAALGFRTTFVTASGLIASLTRAHNENRLEEKLLKLLVQPQLLIIDEIGYLPLERLGANLFFQLVSRRYERELDPDHLPTRAWPAGVRSLATR